MTDMGSNNPSVNKPQILRSIGKLNKSTPNVKKATAEAKALEQTAKPTQPNQPNLGQSLANTNSNISINQTTLTSPVVSQTALNQSPSNLKTSSTAQTQEPSGQTRTPGSTDLPAYAGISNISFKSWITEHNSRGFANLASGEKQLAATLDGIKGFQKKNQDTSDERSGKNKYFSILAYIFSMQERSGAQEIELFSNLFNFDKLGSSEKDNKLLTPPLPEELHKLYSIDTEQIKFLHQLLALPKEFPECVRFFSKNTNELILQDMKVFLEQRLKIAQEQILGAEGFLLGDSIAKFTPLLNERNFSQILPLVLLYYPLPYPGIKTDFDFTREWEEKKREKAAKKELILASCEVYYLSKQRGRFLLRFELAHDGKFNFNIQTANENEDIISALEAAISESMFLLQDPPLLSDLNVQLTQEIYKTVSQEEELSIISTGPLRIEIVLSVYSVLTVLNKLSS